MKDSKPATILLLAGTGEARRLAGTISEKLPETRLITSLAGVTSKPAPVAGVVRQGGFGGVEGLKSFLTAESVDAVVDATHPFAARITCNAFEACQHAGIPFLRLERPAWQAQPGDDWHHTATLEEAASRIPALGGRVLLTVGSKDLAAFRTVKGPEIFARMTEPAEAAQTPPGCHIILERGPFDLAHERALLSRLKIELLVTKNSGGNAVAAKLDAARELGIPVLIIDRPAADIGPRVASVDDAVIWVKEKVEG